MILSIGICSAVVGFGTASASTGSGNGATVQRDPYGNITCNVINSDGTASWDFACDIQIVIAPDGTVNETAKGPVVAGSSPLPTQAVKVGSVYTGQLCDPNSGAIYSSGTVSPSGNVILSCSSNPLAFTP